MIQKSILLQNSLDIQRFLGCSRLGLGVGVLVGALHGDSRFRESEELFLGVARVDRYTRAIGHRANRIAFKLIVTEILCCWEMVHIVDMSELVAFKSYDGAK